MEDKQKTPEWKVYFDGGFGEPHGNESAGREISLNKQFVWDKIVWHVPAIYVCNKGLVMDFCISAPAECIRSFMDKWNLTVANTRTDITNEQQMQIDAENPLVIDIILKTALNGSVLWERHGHGVYWNPCFSGHNNPMAKRAIEHYGLDTNYGWTIWRACFPWTKKHETEIKTLSIMLKQRPVAVPGPHFHVSAPGECIMFTHPTTGIQHTLTVQEYEQQQTSHERFDNQDLELPTHFTSMSYTLSPDLPDDAFAVIDCARSDNPRQERANPTGSPASSVCVSVGVICGASGPAIIFKGGGQGKLRAACSAVHFEAVDNVEWFVVFHEQRREDISVELI